MVIDTAIQLATAFILFVVLALAMPALRFFGSIAPQWAIADHDCHGLHHLLRLLRVL